MRNFWVFMVITVLASTVYSVNFPNISYGTISTLTTGVTYQHASQSTPDKWQIYILRVDLNQSNIIVRPVIPATGNTAKTSVMSTTYHAIGGINGGYFDTGTGSLLSLTQIYDFMVAKPLSPGIRPPRSCLGILPDRTLTIQRVADVLTTVSGYNWVTTYHGIGGGPNLLTNGIVSVTTTEEGFDTASGIGPVSRNPRTAVGYTTTGQLVMVVVDGRQSSWSVGMTLTEMAQFLQDIGVQYAMNLDGGGSSTLVTGGTVRNSPSDGNERAVANGLMVFYDTSIDSSIVIDNDSTGFTRTSGWGLSQSAPGFFNMTYYAIASSAAVGNASTMWQPTITTNGQYEVFASWAPDVNRATNAPYSVVYHGGSINTTVNQQFSGAKWNSLGTYYFSSGNPAKVILSNNANGYVISDAVKFEYRSAVPVELSEFISQ